MKYEVIGSSSKGNCMEEIWKPIEDFKDKYEISNLGRIRNKETSYIFIPQKRGKYLKVSLSKNGIKRQLSIHKLVAETFLNKSNFKCMPDENRSLINMDKLEVNHKNEDKYDNRINNLEWCTHKYNSYYSKCIEKCSKAKEKPINQYDLKGNFIKTWDSINEASKLLNIPQSCISRCVRGLRNKTHNYKFRYVKE